MPSESTPVINHSSHAERGVLGLLIDNGNLIAHVIDKLNPEDFYDATSRLTYAAICSLYKDGNPIGFITVRAALKKAGVQDLKSWFDGLHDSRPIESQLPFYVAMISDHADRRRLLKLADSVSEEAYSDSSVEQIIQHSQDSFGNILGRRQQTQSSSLLSIATSVYADIERRFEAGGISPGVQSGFPAVDSIISGFKVGFTVIGARPSMGKTSWALDCALRIARRGLQPVFFSLEMSREQLVEKVFANFTEIDSQNLASGRINGSDLSRLSKAIATMEKMHMDIFDLKDKIDTVAHIEARLKRMEIAGNKPGIVFVDYLGLLRGMRTDTKNLEIEEISHGLKAMAIRMDLPVVVLCQLSRKLEERQNKRPGMSDLRDSGSIEQDADLVIFLYRDEYYNPDTTAKGQTEIIVAKHRTGPIGKATLLFQASTSQFHSDIYQFDASPTRYTGADSAPIQYATQEKE